MKEELLINGFVAFIKNGPDIVDKLNELDLSFPNIPFPTMGGKVFWLTLKDVNGWKLQRNSFTQHYRILDPDNIQFNNI